MTKRRILLGSWLVLVLGGLLSPGVPAADAAPAGEGESPAAETAAAEEPAPTRRHGDAVSVFGGEIRVPAGVEQWGDLFSLGGDVIVDGRVRGDVVVVGGTLNLTGSVDGNVVGVFSNLTARDAEIEHQLISIAGTLDHEGTSVGGQRVNIGFGKGWLTLTRPFGVLGGLLFWARLLRLLVVFVMLVLLVALVPERVRVISEETPQRLFAAFFVGLLGYLGLWIAIRLIEGIEQEQVAQMKDACPDTIEIEGGAVPERVGAPVVENVRRPPLISVMTSV